MTLLDAFVIYIIFFLILLFGLACLKVLGLIVGIFKFKKWRERKTR